MGSFKCTYASTDPLALATTPSSKHMRVCICLDMLMKFEILRSPQRSLQAGNRAEDEFSASGAGAPKYHANQNFYRPTKKYWGFFGM